MKKLISLFIFTALFTGVVQSQAFTKDSFIANLGIGFGWYGYGYSVSSFPAISLSAEKGVWDVEDVGVISLGGIVGYKFSKYDWSYANYSYDWKWTDFVVAARSAIHPVLIDNDKVDFYGSLALGVRFEKYKYYAPTFMGEPQNYTDNDVNVLVAVYAGCRYYFSDHFAAFGEFGYGLGYFNIGATYKL